MKKKHATLVGLVFNKTNNKFFAQSIRTRDGTNFERVGYAKEVLTHDVLVSFKEWFANSGGTLLEFDDCEILLRKNHEGQTPFIKSGEHHETQKESDR